MSKGSKLNNLMTKGSESLMSKGSELFNSMSKGMAKASKLFDSVAKLGRRVFNLMAKLAPPKGLYWLQPPAARSVAATNVTSVYQTNVTSAGPTDTLFLCSNVSVGPANIKSVWATDVTFVASGRRYRGGL
ncbi:hypothetical protein PCANC_13520 [Puccinia coronata f. sp. avenae]|uniref:Uncharacterized protein n=1 Tax=Puccinia coronata f. sp. avenae TaxID=200324 RepID=A0A2N5UT12_9BASI|nr:hypothetical protein PCANC_13520 [Puccinia coronata f. sp. avenae]